MKALLRDFVKDLGGLGHVARAGHCRFASVVGFAILVGIVIDLDHYEDEADLPLWDGIAEAFASCGLMQYLHAVTLTTVPALVILLIGGLVRTRRLRPGAGSFFERIEVIEPGRVSRWHAYLFWVAITCWVAYLVVGRWLVQNAGLEFRGEGFAHWGHLHDAYFLQVLSTLASFGGDVLLALLALGGTLAFEVLRKLWQKKPAPVVAPTVEVEPRGGGAKDTRQSG